MNREAESKSSRNDSLRPVDLCQSCLNLEYGQFSPGSRYQPRFTRIRSIKPSDLRTSAKTGCKLCHIIWQGTNIFYPELFDGGSCDRVGYEPENESAAPTDSEPGREISNIPKDDWINLEIHPEGSFTIEILPQLRWRLRVELFTRECKPFCFSINAI